MTSPATGDDYAPIPRSALGPALNEQGYYVGRVQWAGRGSRGVQATARLVNVANHRDPVRTAHLPDGKPGSVAMARTAAMGRAPDSREIP